MAMARDFSRLDIYLASFSLFHDIGPKLEHGGQYPVGPVVCNDCGAITTHALGVLDLLRTRKKGKDDEK